MATVIIRPTGEPTSTTGFDVSDATFIARINDNDASTAATQNNVTCSATGVEFENKSDYDSATVNSITISVTGASTGRGAPTVTCTLFNGNSTLQTSELTFSSATTLSGSAYTTNLTPAIVNNLTATIDPDGTGVALKEVFITVDYGSGGGGGGAAAGYTHKVLGVAAANVAKVNTVATANIGKINTVD